MSPRLVDNCFHPGCPWLAHYLTTRGPRCVEHSCGNVHCKLPTDRPSGLCETHEGQLAAWCAARIRRVGL